MATWQDNLAASNANLIGAYDFEGASGPVVDSSPAGNDGTNNGATREVTGKIGNGFDFDGSTDNVDIPPMTASQQMTFSAWANPDTLSADMSIISTWGAKNLQIRVKAADNIEFGIVDATGNFTSFGSTGTVSTGSYQHVVVRVDGTDVDIFIDNVKESGSINAFNNDTYTETSVGNYPAPGPVRFFDGKIDMAYIWNTALSDTQVSDLYNAGSGLVIPPPKSSFSLGPRVQLRQEKSSFSLAPRVQLRKAKESFSLAPRVQLKQVKSGFSLAPRVQLKQVKSGFSLAPRVQLKQVKSGFSLAPRVQLRGDGINSYYITLINATGDVVDSVTVFPPTTSIADVFTAPDGDYTARIQTRTQYHNRDVIYGDTYLNVTLASGSIDVDEAIPNDPELLVPSVAAGGAITLTWGYNPVGEKVAPEEFVIYVNGIEETTAGYSTASRFSKTITSLPEVSTSFQVTARATSGESDGPTVVETPDSTPPEPVAMEFNLR